MSQADERVAVVTGAGGGIGASIALALAEERWTVVLADNRADALASVAARSGRRLDPIPTDITDERQVRLLFDSAARRHGRIDVLVNNAGINVPPRDVDQVPLAE